jgi:hypothetical protein
MSLEKTAVKAGESTKRIYLEGMEMELELLRRFQQQLALLRQLRSKTELTVELSLVFPEKQSLGKYQLPRLIWPS